MPVPSTATTPANADVHQATLPRRPLEILTVLDAAIAQRASDIFLTPNLPPALGIRGEPRALPTGRLDATQINAIVNSMAPEQAVLALEEHGQADFAYLHTPRNGPQRNFRCNVTSIRDGTSCTFRLIPNEIPTPEQLGIKPIILELMHRDKGLFLVTGQTGSGKSTTLASLMDYITTERAVKAITLEQPIEYVFKNKEDVGGVKGALSIIEQQDIPYNIPSYADALRAAMRRAPNIIMVGELRDLDTITAALQAAETGHLVLATLHTNTAIDSISRIVNVAPEARTNEIRQLLSTTLIGVMSQVLLKQANGEGRVMAYEFMYNSQAVAGKIRDEQKTATILNEIQTGGQKQMQTLEMDLHRLVKLGQVTESDARGKAARPEAFDSLMHGTVTRRN